MSSEWEDEEGNSSVYEDDSEDDEDYGLGSGCVY